MADLVALISEITGEPNQWMIHQKVTRLLDRYIDAGSVVPTTMEDNNKIYRIYRKGEADNRIPAAELVQFALDEYSETLSFTRLTKLLTALWFGRGDDTMLEVATIQRGNVLRFTGNLLDEGEVFTDWLRKTKRIVRK